MTDDPILPRPEASEFLSELGPIYAIAPTTLAKLAVVGGGPPMVKFGRRVGYRRSELRRWAEGRTRDVASTSDASEI